jgi:hypothetical protein
VVHGRDGVRFTATATTPTALVARLSGYVRRSAGHQLWPADAEVVLALLEKWRFEKAVELYFALVGSRWDEEWLVTAVLNPPEPRATSATTGAIVTASQPPRRKRRARTA